jgi:Ser-tRNA(Ala) deacylase AlaX
VKLSDQDKGCPCGGTHVKHLKDIIGVTVTKIKKKGKGIRISYVIDEAKK